MADAGKSGRKKVVKTLPNDSIGRRVILTGPRALRENPYVTASRERLPLVLDALRLSSRPVIHDIGANPINLPPYHMLRDEGVVEIVGFEPHPGAFEKLMAEKAEAETYFPIGIGGGGTAKLNIYSGSGYTSVYRLREETLQLFGLEGGMTTFRRDVEIETKRLDDVADLPPPDLFKIDIQGGELDVFQNGRETLRSAMCIITEVPFLPLYEGAPSMGDIDRELRSQGFVLHRFMETSSKVMASSQSDRLRAHTPFTKTQVIDTDAVYLRDITRLDLMEDETLKQLVLFADNVFGSCDLALRAMDELVSRGLLERDFPAAYVDALPPQIRL